MTYRIGAKYVATERLDVRMGIYYDQSPIRKHNYNRKHREWENWDFLQVCHLSPIKTCKLTVHFYTYKESEEMAHTLTNTVPTVFSQDTTIHMPSRLR